MHLGFSTSLYGNEKDEKNYGVLSSRKCRLNLRYLTYDIIQVYVRQYCRIVVVPIILQKKKKTWKYKKNIFFLYTTSHIAIKILWAVLKNSKDEIKFHYNSV